MAAAFNLETITVSEFDPYDKIAIPNPAEETYDYENAELLKNNGIAARNSGNYSDAKELFTNAMQSAGATTALLALRAESLLLLNRPSAALWDCNAALELNPDSSKILRLRGVANAYLGRWIQANKDIAAGQNIDFSTDFESCRRVASEKAAIIEQEEIAKRLAHEEAKREELRVQREIALEKQKKERALGDLGSRLFTKSGLQSTVDALGSSRLIGLYFSAHWCPPCRQFTPILAEIYTSLREEEESITKNLAHVLEVIFVSSDRDQHSYDEYYHSMPWLSIPFGESYVKQELASKYSVSGIPAFFVIDSNTGTLIDGDGRSTVMSCRGNLSQLLKKWKII